ncbi:MAG: hypothetical protein ACR2J0_02765 [Mycobacteriales bacterium]
MAAPPSRGRIPVPVPVRRAAAVVLVEGLALLLLCGSYAVRVLFGRPENRALAVSGAAMGLAAGALVALLAGALFRGRRGAASPVLVVQLLALPVGIGLLQGHLPLYAAAVLLPAVVVLALLLGTASGRAIFAR